MLAIDQQDPLKNIKEVNILHYKGGNKDVRTYIKDKILGAGGTATTYKVVDKFDPTKQFALKVFIIRPNKYFHYFEQEAFKKISLLSDITQCNTDIICMFGYIYLQGISLDGNQKVDLYCLLLELMDGTLMDAVNKNMLTEYDMYNLIISSIKGLNFIHEKGYAHGDITPYNILYKIDNGGLIFKISDLGGLCNETGQYEAITCAKTITKMYDSIEFTKHRNSLISLQQSQSNDVWALGLTLFQVLFSDLSLSYRFQEVVTKNFDEKAINDYFNSIKWNMKLALEENKDYYYFSDDITELLTKYMLVPDNTRKTSKFLYEYVQTNIAEYIKGDEYKSTKNNYMFDKKYILVNLVYETPIKKIIMKHKKIYCVPLLYNIEKKSPLVTHMIAKIPNNIILKYLNMNYFGTKITKLPINDSYFIVQSTDYEPCAVSYHSYFYSKSIKLDQEITQVSSDLNKQFTTNVATFPLKLFGKDDGDVKFVENSLIGKKYVKKTTTINNGDFVNLDTFTFLVNLGNNLSGIITVANCDDIADSNVACMYIIINNDKFKFGNINFNDYNFANIINNSLKSMVTYHNYNIIELFNDLYLYGKNKIRVESLSYINEKVNFMYVNQYNMSPVLYKNFYIVNDNGVCKISNRKIGDPLHFDFTGYIFCKDVMMYADDNNKILFKSISTAKWDKSEQWELIIVPENYSISDKTLKIKNVGNNKYLRFDATNIDINAINSIEIPVMLSDTYSLWYLTNYSDIVAVVGGGGKGISKIYKFKY